MFTWKTTITFCIRRNENTKKCVKVSLQSTIISFHPVSDKDQFICIHGCAVVQGNFILLLDLAYPYCLCHGMYARGGCVL